MLAYYTDCVHGQHEYDVAYIIAWPTMAFKPETIN